MNEKDRYAAAAASLPDPLRLSALAQPAALRARAEEFRLRLGRPPTLSADGRERPFAETSVSDADIARVLELATRSSLHTALESLREGYVTTPDGHRIGVAGTAALNDRRILTLRRITSVCIRIARCFPGAAQPVFDILRRTEGGTLIVSPPGLGKTTLLRDLVRLYSDSGVRTALVDERGELAGDGFDLGRCTDVLTGVPKALAVPMLLRAMSPALIAMDEIAAADDVAAMEQAVGCGAVLMATAHGASLADVTARPALENVLRRGAFRHAVFIERRGGERRYRVEALR